MQKTRGYMNRLKEWKKEILEHKKQIIIAIIFLAIASILNYCQYLIRISIIPNHCHPLKFEN